MIVLIRGYRVEVDEEDAWLALDGPWTKYGRLAYFHRTRNGKRECLHRIIAGAKEGDVVDHVNLDTLDNRKSNLRLCTPQQSAMNRRGGRKNRTGMKGVYRDIGRNRYRSSICVKGKKYHLGTFDTPQEAHKAYKEAALRYAGEFARW